MSCAQESKVIILIKTVVIYFILLRREAEKPPASANVPYRAGLSAHLHAHIQKGTGASRVTSGQSTPQRKTPDARNLMPADSKLNRIDANKANRKEAS